MVLPTEIKSINVLVYTQWYAKLLSEHKIWVVHCGGGGGGVGA